MASIINTAIGLEFKNGVLNTIVGNFKDVKNAALSVSSGISDINKKIKSMASIQSIAALGIVMKNTADSVKSIALGVKKSFESVQGYASAGDKISKTSKLLGLSVGEYQALGSAAMHSGMSIEDMDKAMAKFNVNLAKARSGDKTSKKMFDSILPKGSKLSDYKNSSSLIIAIADSYTKLSNAEDKAFASQRLFGESGLKMSELLNNGSSGVKQMLDDYAKNGGGFDESGAENAALFNDELQKTQETLNSIKISVMQELFPTFIEMFKDIRSYAQKDGGEIKTLLKDLGVYVSEFVRDSLPKIVSWMKDFLSLMKSIGSKWMAIIGGVVTVAPVVVNVLGVLHAVYRVVASVFGFIPRIFRAIVFIKDIVWAIVSGFKIAAAVLGGSFFATLGLVVAAVVSWGIAIKSIYDNFDLLKSFVKDDVFPAIQGVAVKIGDFFAMVGDKFLGLFHGIESIAMGIASAVSNFCMNLFSGIIDFVEKINDKIQSVISFIPGKLKDLFGVGNAIDVSANVAAPSQIATAVQQSYSVTTNRFAVDFNNVPRGTNITPPPQGDFDWSRSYTLAGAV